MANQATSTNQVDPAVALWYDRVLLERALPELIHDLFGQQRSLKKKSGNTIKFRRYNSLGIRNVPLAEGQPPPLDQLSKTDLLAQIMQFGGAVAITDVVHYTIEDDEMNETIQLQGEQLGLTLDTLTRDVLCASASYFTCTKGQNAQAITELNTYDIDGAATALLGGNAKMLTEIKNASTGIGTLPIRRAFCAIGHTDQIPALQNCFEFISVEKYASGGPMHETEWGSVHNTRWLLSTNAKKTGSGPSIYSNLLFGRNAYGVIELDDGTIENIFHDFGSAGPMDPLNQLATMGWKTWFTARILNDLFMLVLASTNKFGT